MSGHCFWVVSSKKIYKGGCCPLIKSGGYFGPLDGVKNYSVTDHICSNYITSPHQAPLRRTSNASEDACCSNSGVILQLVLVYANGAIKLKVLVNNVVAINSAKLIIQSFVKISRVYLLNSVVNHPEEPRQRNIPVFSITIGY